MVVARMIPCCLFNFHTCIKWIPRTPQKQLPKQVNEQHEQIEYSTQVNTNFSIRLELSMQRLPRRIGKDPTRNRSGSGVNSYYPYYPNPVLFIGEGNAFNSSNRQR
jgi:hypothetical protein